MTRLLRHTDHLTSLLLFLFILALLFVPTGFERLVPDSRTRSVGTVIETDNTLLRTHGIVRTGTQQVRLHLHRGPFRGREVVAENRMMGKLEFDKIYATGDSVLVTIDAEDDRILHVNAVDHYRLPVEFTLLYAFVLLMLVLARTIGLKSILTFFFTALLLWKVLFPGILKGLDPIVLSLACVMLLTAVILFAIAGPTRKGVVAFCGAISGVLLTALVSIVFGHLFQIHGAVRPFSETLLYTGFPALDITRLFIAGIFIASSGAVMDVAMDIAVSMDEVTRRSPSMRFSERLETGLSVGRAVIGTMTTTLLLAYSGGYSALFLVFLAQGTPVSILLNLQYVAAEILHTLVGSFGLVAVAPLTAGFGALLFSPAKAAPSPCEPAMEQAGSHGACDRSCA